MMELRMRLSGASGQGVLAFTQAQWLSLLNRPSPLSSLTNVYIVAVFKLLLWVYNFSNWPIGKSKS